MYKKLLFFAVIFALGVVTTIALESVFEPRPTVSTTTYVVANADTVKAEDNSHFITKILGISPEEKPSPYDWVPERMISVEYDKVTIRIQGAQWARFTDTNSMDPAIDEGANAIQIIPKDESEVHIGDIVSYESEYSDGTIIHRVQEIGYDEKGWYCLMKGDNNPRVDPGKVRFNQIKRITVAIIY